ncbi:TetR/AcrR family transcriptional regulator [Acetobacter conturbans]|uniref:TetR family transcriptional regulator n=1 Tax=Acetobacter conturbans TaxID=1737472 RepID=A0ABX0JWE3_9PROT|nr:TetR/AcrR family transcriptional regulator [Acetobacter conturbans]NHN87169.1 TetR family transcriptional regulator [Acetobacter conturbans]
MTTSAAEGARRGSPELWIDAACEALLESGIDAVKILPLANKLNLSRTSFYWFFKDREELLDALISRWREKNTGSIVKQASAYAATIVEATLNVFDCWIDGNLFDSRFEFAVRSWALQSPEIFQEVDAADTRRLQSLVEMFRRFDFSETDADVRAHALYLVQIGYISRQTKEDVANRLKRIPSYVEIFTGQPPQQHDLDRFFSRHEGQRADTPS